MAGKYVIPSLRNQKGKDASDSSTAKGDSDSGYDIREIFAHFWPTEYEDQHSAADGQPRTITQTLHATHTLNAAAETPGQLTWLKLHRNANPAWESDRIIFVKSRLDFLPTQSEDVETESGELAPQQPIAVFTQTRGSSFDFAGWYQVSRVKICEPRSPELYALLDQKWAHEDRHGNRTDTKRSGPRWIETVARRWASVKLEEDLIASKERGAPKIARLPDLRDTKTVNERLAEMRDAGGRQQDEKKEIKTAKGV